jgi:tripartite-type tricarboxylate transporter receptor subunit TctC
LHVPYKGGGPVLVDLVAGRVQFAMTGQTPVMPMVKDKRLKALAFAALKRSPLLPDVPTLHESLMPGFEIGAWFWVLTPAHTPPAIIRRLNVEIAKAVQDAEMRARLAQEGAEPLISSPEQYGAHFKSEFARWSRLVQSAGLKVE